MEIDSQAKATGTVKFFNASKGWGFIAPADGGAELFVHQTNIISEGFRSLADGEQVEYVVETDPNGRQKAVNVTGPGGNPVKGAPRRDDFGGGGGGGRGAFGGGARGGGFAGGNGGGGGYRRGGGAYGAVGRATSSFLQATRAASVTTRVVVPKATWGATAVPMVHSRVASRAMAGKRIAVPAVHSRVGATASLRF